MENNRHNGSDDATASSGGALVVQHDTGAGALTVSSQASNKQIQVLDCGGGGGGDVRRASGGARAMRGRVRRARKRVKRFGGKMNTRLCSLPSGVATLPLVLQSAADTSCARCARHRCAAYNARRRCLRPSCNSSDTG